MTNLFISEKRAKYLSDLSYRICTINNNSELITLKKAMELDKDVAESIIKDYEIQLKALDMKEKALAYGSYAKYLGRELVNICNLRYVDSYEINIDSMNVKMKDKSKVILSSTDRVFAPNIYGDLLPTDDNGLPNLPSRRWWELYFKLLIIEDRQINPYMIHSNSKFINTKTYAFPMKETLEWIEYYNKDIEIVNRLLDKCNGYIFTDVSKHGININLKATILYLEDIDENELANDLRKFRDDEVFLNLVIDKALKGIYGIIIDNDENKVILI